MLTYRAMSMLNDPLAREEQWNRRDRVNLKGPNVIDSLVSLSLSTAVPRFDGGFFGDSTWRVFLT